MEEHLFTMVEAMMHTIQAQRQKITDLQHELQAQRWRTKEEATKKRQLKAQLWASAPPPPPQEPDQHKKHTTRTQPAVQNNGADTYHGWYAHWQETRGKRKGTRELKTTQPESHMQEGQEQDTGCSGGGVLNAKAQEYVPLTQAPEASAPPNAEAALPEGLPLHVLKADAAADDNQLSDSDVAQLQDITSNMIEMWMNDLKGEEEAAEDEVERFVADLWYDLFEIKLSKSQVRTYYNNMLAASTFNSMATSMLKPLKEAIDKWST